LVVLLFLVFLIGEGPPRPSLLIPVEKLTLAANFIMLLGLVVAWRSPGIGGAVAVSGYLLFGLVGGARMLTMPPFAVAGFAGCLHLLSWGISDHSEWKRHGGPKRLEIALTVLAIASVTVWAWLSAGAKSLDAQVNNIPQVAGRWIGTSRVSDTLLRKKELDLDITILPDGSFQGQIGNATITSGKIQPHLKGRIGYLENKMGEPPYVMVLDLSGPPLATPRRSRPSVTVCFDVRGEQLIAGVHATDGPEDLRDLHAVLHR